MNAFKPVIGIIMLVASALLGVLSMISRPHAQRIAQKLDFLSGTLDQLAFFAVVNTKSTVVTNGDATPVDLSAAYLSHGRLREAVGTLEAVNGDSIGSVYRLVRIWSGCRASQVLLACDAITTCAGDVGLYKTAADGGAVVDADFFASAQSLAAALTGTDVTHESGVFGVEAVEKRLWEALGLTADPKIWYDVAVTLTAAAGSAGTVSAKVRYTDGT